MKVIVSSLIIIMLSLSGLVLVEWLPRMGTPVTPVYAAGFAIYPQSSQVASDVLPDTGVVPTGAEVPKEESDEENDAEAVGDDVDGAEGNAAKDVHESDKPRESRENALVSDETVTEKPLEQQQPAKAKQRTEIKERKAVEKTTSEASASPETQAIQRDTQTITWVNRVNRSVQAPEVQQGRQVSQPQSTATTTTVTVQVMSAAKRQPVKANVYVQRENGVHVSRKRYVERAHFELLPGRYKITVRADGHQDAVRSVQVGHQVLQQTFALQHQRPQQSPRQAAQPPIHRAHYQAASKPQVHTTPAQQHSRQQQSQQREAIRQAAQQHHAQPQPVVREGRLQLHAVSAADGQPLAVNFRITSPDGRTLHHAPNVAYADMRVPVGQVRIHIQHQGLAGSEMAYIQAGETTAHTFSVVSATQPVATTQASEHRYVSRPRLGLGVGIGPLVFRLR